MENENEILMNPKCDNCKKGQRQLELTRQLKTRHAIMASKELMEFGRICYQCIYCKTGKTSAKIYKRISQLNPKGPQFRAFDLFEPIEVKHE